MWALQHTYWGRVTLLQEPGRLVLADPTGRVRALEGLSPREWLAAELEGGVGDRIANGGVDRR